MRPPNNYTHVVRVFRLQQVCDSCGMWEASDFLLSLRRQPVPSPPRRAAATLAAVVLLAVVAPSGPVAATSPAGSALAPGAGATLQENGVAPYPVDPAVATFPVRGVSRAGL